MSLNPDSEISYAHIAMPGDTFHLVSALIRRLGGDVIKELTPDEFANAILEDDEALDDDAELITKPPIPEHERIGRMLKGARLRENMTQDVLAKAIGVPQRHISEYEANKRPIPADKVALLAEILNTVETHFIPR